MTYEKFAEMEPGDLLVDTTTLHEAYLEGFYPNSLGAAHLSLAQLVDAIVLHEKLFVMGDLLEFDEQAKRIADQLPNLLFAVPLEPTHRAALTNTLEELLNSANGPLSRLRRSAMWGLIPTMITETDDQEPDIRFLWANLDYFSRQTRTHHHATSGISSRVDSWTRYKELRVARSLLYYLVSRTFGLAYAPNPSRTTCLIYLSRVMGPPIVTPAGRGARELEEIVEKCAQYATDAFGLPAIRFDIPLFLQAALEEADSVEGILENAVRIRNLRPVAGLRRWCTDLTKAFQNGQQTKVVQLLQSFNQKRNEVLEQLRPGARISISLALPWGLSVGREGIGMRRSPVWFLRDLVEFGLGVGELRPMIPYPKPRKSRQGNTS